MRGLRSAAAVVSANREPVVLEITPEARAKFIAAVREDPYTGIARAALAAGIPGSTGQRRQLVAQDAEIQYALAEARREVLVAHHLGVHDLFDKLAFVVHDDGNSSQLRAVQTGLAMHGIAVSEVHRVEHTGRDGGPLEVENPDVAAAIDRFSAQLRRLGERADVESGAGVRELGPGPAELDAGDAGA